MVLPPLWAKGNSWQGPTRRYASLFRTGGLGVPGSNPGAPTKIAAAIAARRDAIPRACLHCDFGRFCTVSALTPRPVLVAEDRRAASSLAAPSSPYPAQGPQRPIKTPTA